MYGCREASRIIMDEIAKIEAQHLLREYTYIYVYICVCMYVCFYAYIHMCMYMYIILNMVSILEAEHVL
jgi:hypothetical protein